MITETGVEGGVIYAVAPYLREEIRATGRGTLRLDLAPDRELPRLIKDLSQPRGKKTMATHLQRRAHIEGVKSGLLREIVSKEDFTDPARLAAAIKSLPAHAGGAASFGRSDQHGRRGGLRGARQQLMFSALPGMFCAGEMLDWEAPTGGYLLTACFASGRAAGVGAVAWLTERAGHDRIIIPQATRVVVLIVPGIGNSGPRHWQTLWERQHPDWRRVQQRDWDHPVCDEWRRGLDDAIGRLSVAAGVDCP